MEDVELRVRFYILIVDYTFMHLITTHQKIHGRIRTSKVISFISSLTTRVHFLNSVLPHPVTISLSCFCSTSYAVPQVPLRTYIVD